MCTKFYLNSDFALAILDSVVWPIERLRQANDRDGQSNCSHALPIGYSLNAIDANTTAMMQLQCRKRKINDFIRCSLALNKMHTFKWFLLSKCWACSIRNCEPCSHCRSSSCSRLCGVLPWAVGWPVPPSIELKLGPCGWLDALFRAYNARERVRLK